MMVQFFFYIWLAITPLIIAGCGLGPSMMRADRLTYNDAIQFTERRELLLNIVRLKYNDLILSTRSVLGTMAYLAQGVNIPAEHIEAGVASYSEEESITGIISDLFKVNVKKEKPHQAGLAVPYKGYWFYIDKTDISSKRTIGVLNSLVRLKIRAGSAQNIPVLTLPVGK
jgi:hypothetical protein